MTSTTLLTEPVLCTPIYKEKIWGGQNLHTVLGKTIPSRQRVGESWELSGYGSDTSIIASGPYQGKTLQELVTKKRRELLGAASNAPFFPLLFKFIDAHDNLSVQVHPDDNQARIFTGDTFGKTECWYIADVKPGGTIIVGFKKGVTVADVEDGIRSNTLETLLNYIPIVRGDVLFIPAGTVHAILEGTLIYEVQETSDITLRLYDWGRVDDRGNPRQLHVADSLRVLDFTYHEEHKIAPVSVVENKNIEHFFRVACKYFALEEFICHGQTDITLQPKQSFSVLSVLEGSLSLRSGAGPHVSISQGQTVLLPAACYENDVSVTCPDKGRFLCASVPELQTEVINFLRGCGVMDDRIRKLGGHAAHNDLLALMSG